MRNNNVDTTEELPTVLSFCSGYGGLESGLDLAGVDHRVVSYVEIESHAIANLVAKMESGQLHPAPIFTNLKTFPAHLFRDCVDIITGGYPCQPFSAAGKRKAEDDPRHLWPHIREHIQAIKPSTVFFENVEGHLSRGLESVIGDLSEDGFKSTFGLFGTKDLGFIHERKRVYILAHSDSFFSRRRETKDRVQKRIQNLQVKQQSMVWSEATKCLGDQPRQGFHSKPCIRRGDDGSANWLDRHRLLGNGVVPQQAAKAWLTLSEE